MGDGEPEPESNQRIIDGLSNPAAIFSQLTPQRQLWVQAEIQQFGYTNNWLIVAVHRRHLEEQQEQEATAAARAAEPEYTGRAAGRYDPEALARGEPWSAPRTRGSNPHGLTSAQRNAARRRWRNLCGGPVQHVLKRVCVRDSLHAYVSRVAPHLIPPDAVPHVPTAVTHYQANFGAPGSVIPGTGARQASPPWTQSDELAAHDELWRAEALRRGKGGGKGGTWGEGSVLRTTLRVEVPCVPQSQQALSGGAPAGSSTDTTLGAPEQPEEGAAVEAAATRCGGGIFRCFSWSAGLALSCCLCILQSRPLRALATRIVLGRVQVLVPWLLLFLQAGPEWAVWPVRIFLTEYLWRIYELYTWLRGPQ